jgi:polysaccharide export outer membrane protein
VATIALMVFLVLAGTGLARAAGEAEYRLGPKDVLRITVFGHDDLTRTATVAPDGRLSFPLLGDIPAAGLTPAQLAARLQELLGKDYLVDPKVSVTVQEYHSQRVFVLGEAERPGTYALTGRDTLVDVLSQAGGPGKAAGRHVLVVRAPSAEGPLAPGASGSTTLRVDIKKLLEGDRAENRALQNGDTIFIPKITAVFILGEIAKPGAYTLDKETNALEAVTLAGGFTERAAPGGAKVLRKRADGTQETLEIDLSGADARARELALAEGDTLLIPRGNAFFVSGEVRRPGPYQLQRSTTALGGISMAGGFTDKAGRSQVKLTRRIGPDKEEVTVLDLSGADARARELPLRDGDILQVPGGNTFYVLGEVRKPGSYQLDQATTALQGAALAGGFTDKAAPGRAKIIRTHPDGRQETLTVDLAEAVTRGGAGSLFLQNNDTLHVPKVTSVFVLGEVAKPGAYTLEERESSALEAITLAGGFTERAAPDQAKLQRKRADGTQETLELDLSGGSPKARETLLSEGDTLLIPRGQRTLFISGEVRKPGPYPVDRSTTAFSAITLAGGFTERAAAGQVKLIRRLPSGDERTHVLDLSGADARARDFPLLEGDTLLVPSGNAFYVLGEVRKPGPYPIGQATTAIGAVLMAGGFTDRGAQNQVKLTRRLPSGDEQITTLDLSGADARAREFLVRDGDVLFVPVGNTFYVLGEVKKPGAYQLEQLTTAIQAIALAGGFTDRAAPNRTKVIRTHKDGRQETLVIDLNQVIKGGRKDKDIPLVANDVVVVPESFF